MPTKKKPAIKAASTKKVAPKKALAKAVAKKVPAKKRVAKAAAAKKKRPIARLLEFHRQGSITKKGLIVSIGIVVVGILAYGGVTIYQNMSANAGGKANLGRGWTFIGNASGYSAGHGGDPASAFYGQLSACKLNSSSKTKIKARFVINNIGNNFRGNNTAISASGWTGFFTGSFLSGSGFRVGATTTSAYSQTVSSTAVADIAVGGTYDQAKGNPHGVAGYHVIVRSLAICS